MEPFITVDEYQVRTASTVPPDRLESVERLIAAATDYLRGICGQHIAPIQTSTAILQPSTSGLIVLPQIPVHRLDRIETLDGHPVEHTWDHAAEIRVRCCDQVRVTWTYGHNRVPELLQHLCAALVSKALANLDRQAAGLTVEGISSIAIDDFKVAFADGGALSGMVLPDLHVAELRRRFGAPSMATVEVSP